MNNNLTGTIPSRAAMEDTVLAWDSTFDIKKLASRNLKMRTKYYVYILDTNEGHIVDAVDFSNETAARQAYLAAKRQWQIQYEDSPYYQIGYIGVAETCMIEYTIPAKGGYRNGWHTERRFTKEEFEFAVTQTKKFINETNDPTSKFMRYVLDVPAERGDKHYVALVTGHKLDNALGIMRHKGLCSIGWFTDPQADSYKTEFNRRLGSSIFEIDIVQCDPFKNDRAVGEISKDTTEEAKSALHCCVALANEIRDLDNHCGWNVIGKSEGNVPTADYCPNDDCDDVCQESYDSVVAEHPAATQTESGVANPAEQEDILDGVDFTKRQTVSMEECAKKVGLSVSTLRKNREGNGITWSKKYPDIGRDKGGLILEKENDKTNSSYRYYIPID